MREDLVALEPYPPPFPIAQIEERLGRPVVKLDANENPYGPSPRVAEALASATLEYYPDAESSELRAHLAAFLGVSTERIICSAGGDEMIDLLLRLFLEPGDEVIDCVPSFVMYQLSTAYNHGRWVPVPRGPGFDLDLEAVEAAIGERTKVIFLCNPNNPTGNRTPEAAIIRLLETGRILILDEAYAEFSGYSHVELGTGYPNLVVTRTMSKWAALAGIRLGYAVVDPAVRENMLKIKSPYNVGVTAQVAGVASLRDRDYLMGNVRLILEERERLRQRLEAWGRGRVYPSGGNYLYWTTGGVDARALKGRMAERGVLVRTFHVPVEALRISIGTPEQSDRALSALEDAYAELAG
jgi:histidinol-phosphate aminotransferase